MKFSRPGGGLEVTVSELETEVQIAIEHSGLDIPEDAMEHFLNESIEPKL